MTDAAPDAVALEQSGETATLWLNRPERGNALGPDIVDGLDAGIDAALAAGARLIVLRGRGRNFCTGLDLGDLEAMSDGDLALRILRIELLLQKISGLPVSTVSVAGGRVFGAGADLFAVCDHRLAMPGASFVFPGPAFGLVLGTARLAGLVGDGLARRLLLSGIAIDTKQAATIGLATAMPAEEDVPALLEQARQAAIRLDAPTVAALHGRTRAIDDAGDLAALARSVARPGLKDRIMAYRAQARPAPKP